MPEPVILDDEYITKDGLGVQPDNSKSRICAFVAAIRLHVVLEGVVRPFYIYPPFDYQVIKLIRPLLCLHTQLDGCVRPSDFASSPFLSKAAQVIAKRHPQSEALREEEALLEDWQGLLEPHWAYGEETVGSKDPIRITQAERLHCLENLVKMRESSSSFRRARSSAGSNHDFPSGGSHLPTSILGLRAQSGRDARGESSTSRALQDRRGVRAGHRCRPSSHRKPPHACLCMSSCSR